ncbi:hypothetical protein FDI85_gp078 [Erwinia phage Machina]|uniref:Uncharacterized protein n=2 Tax=Machinavirus machina TaxID=2169990 RepID=A0A1B2IDG0_9CAUD|nr:hypothetical protein BIZ81_gp077 [Erwinia phage vB_EamM_Huxley]YP_009617123.1 hypothetical protein FDI85_gp078 [Erwinia phage Machina]ANZ49288.1 hypothetical protein HUXLEY_206 [Erwinia phage vB_EamM_Huxley]ANZ49844.1 hypothetical protein MACHINA_206 [Erwinia phage Machina]ANZ50116.1 hypothetical protein PARSHIK_207 [Erwinia phage vB_EamM_Parshik]
MTKVIPEHVSEALKELSGVHRPLISSCTEAERTYLHSTLAIALRWYEKDTRPVAEGYKRTFYYTRKDEFPHTYVFTHSDEIINHAHLP